VNLICRKCGGRQWKLKPKTRREWICQGCRHHYWTGRRECDPELRLAKPMRWPAPDPPEIRSGLISCLDPRLWERMPVMVEPVWVRI